MRAKYLMLCLAAMLMCSCSSVKHSATTATVNSKVMAFTVGELEVGPSKVSMTYSWDWNPFRRVSIPTIKDNTTAELLKMTNCDVLVEPQYIISQRGFMRGGSLTVSGFPAKYKNFHPLTPQEAEVVKALGNTIEEKKTKKRKKLLIF